MNKNEKIIIAVILIVIAIIIVSATLKNGNSEENISNTMNETNTLKQESIENVEEVENEVIENIISNEVEEQPIIENVTEVEPQGTVYESGANHGTTDKKQQAINLVKEKWGEDNTVTFRCDSVTSDGEYIIAVISTQTASVKNYFRVNLANETVTIEY